MLMIGTTINRIVKVIWEWMKLKFDIFKTYDFERLRLLQKIWRQKTTGKLTLKIFNSSCIIEYLCNYT